MASNDPLILSLDEGTTNAKAILVNRAGGVVARSSQPLSVAHPQAGYAEQDPMAIWQAMLAAIEGCLSQTSAPIAAIAISSQRESVLAWERSTGKPLSPLVSWQCRRSSGFCEALISDGHADLIRELSGLAADPMFSGGKMRWILDSLPDGQARAEEGEICLGTVDSWLLWQLTEGAVFATDASNAARTQLMSLGTVNWCPRLLDLFHIPLCALPEIRPSAGCFGETSTFGRLPPGVPVMSMVGDSHAALFGQGGFLPGHVKATLGTGSSLMTPLPQLTPSIPGLATTVAWQTVGTTYALEGNIVHTGAAVGWASRLLGAGEDLDGLTAEAALLPNNGGVYFVPALGGLGAPHWRPDARGLICGLTDASTRAHIMRATLEAIAFQIRDVFEAMQQACSIPLGELWVDGGATRNEWLMQFQADLLQRPVIRSLSPEVSALGAAHLAGFALGWWIDSAALADLDRPRQRYEPRQAISPEIYAQWKHALSRTLLQA
ncbi:FGGY family carbohydrate kinase [Pseudomonas coleopterorum]|uniref:FGGY family carbohydrate kinase n=1 Tax=Pseudomonas coleopterorum TaxID=1605838 RepID=UPI001786E110|nr:FGGY-family carbohydrate kinase [Pseudomonas coleopterorum]MBD8480367.1 FGGY-family carbohydrate kinase [Pseudomonas coleopterorum]